MIDFFKDIFIFSSETPLIFTRLNFWLFFTIVLAIYSYIYKDWQKGLIVMAVLSLILIAVKSFLWGFFAGLIILNAVFYKKNSFRNAFLFFISVFFYFKTGGFFFFILIFSTLVDFGIGHAIYHANERIYKKLWLALSIAVNLGVLAFFKYDYFITETINSIFNTDLEVVTHASKWSNRLFNTHFDLGVILPPIGISFFTFQTISYSIDVYQKKIKPVRSITDFGFYVSFFPQLVAGPIVRAADFIPQLYKSYSLNKYEFGMGFYLILKGLTKKMLIGDYLAVNLIDRVFVNPASYTGFENLSALFGYSMQVYCDFSGYTDIAIGIALLMGFYLPKNFNSPYKAKSVGDFWKRWHISLSSWLKDYLYIPMGGNRNASLFTYISLGFIILFVSLLAGNLFVLLLCLAVLTTFILLSLIFPSIKLHIITNINIMLTMLIGGLWHGSSWMFVIWGGLNGLGIVVYKYWRKVSPYENIDNWFVNSWKILFTFTFITFTRVWFRGESMQGTAELLSQIFTNFGFEVLPKMLVSYWKPLAILIFGMVMHWLPDKIKCSYRDWFIKSPIYVKIIVTSLILFIIYQSISSENTPFIYFQF